MVYWAFYTVHSLDLARYRDRMATEHESYVQVLEDLRRQLKQKDDEMVAYGEQLRVYMDEQVRRERECFTYRAKQLQTELESTKQLVSEWISD